MSRFTVPVLEGGPAKPTEDRLEVSVKKLTILSITQTLQVIRWLPYWLGFSV